MNRMWRAEAHAAESEVENNQQVWEGEKKGNGERRSPPCLSLFFVCSAQRRRERTWSRGGGASGSQRVGEATRGGREEGRENSASAREFCSAESQ